ncbi:MAG: hypothetical protein KatS3mg077_0764 [Candidatus Binatia bacterium]|nr:MAG: hypothetical protein KatS3mg077_0764 [Candidatus Binatia bacterium]
MLPYVAGIPTYYAAWVLAAVAFLVWAPRCLVRAGVGRFPATLFSMALVIAVFLGAKGTYVLERVLCPSDFPFVAPNWLAGFRLPGGLSLAVAILSIGQRLDLLRLRESMHALAAPAWASVAFVHLGCFLNGCCFGLPSTTPWAVSLSKHSVVFLQQARAGWLPPEAAHTLPVEPLPLYFAVLALFAAASARVLVRQTRGNPFALSVAVYSGGAVGLELLRPVKLWLNVVFYAWLCAWALLSMMQRAPHPRVAPVH